jgi:hypothetical protein
MLQPRTNKKYQSSLLPPSIPEGNECQGEEMEESILGSPWNHQINNIICPKKYET